jgi:S1-C subfamily serine protease
MFRAYETSTGIHLMTDTRTSLAILSDQLADAAATAGNSIVAVHARPRLASTGIHWQDGVVVTTDGTVRRESDISVTLPDGRKLPATLAGRDRRTDLAVLKIPAGSLPTARLGDPASLKPGHLVLALARLGEGGPRVSFGAVSAVGGKWRSWKGGEIDRLLQSNLTLYPGFGGGPLVDATGEIHGINSGGLSRAFATTIPVETVNRTVQLLLERGYVARGWLGATMQPVRFNPAAQRRLGIESDSGLVILSVEPDGPAASAGLLVGDVIVKLSGRAIEDVSDLADALWANDAVGRNLNLDLVRGGELIKADVLIGERPRRSA